jgi:uncharacterized protein (DUF4415 family)
MKDRTTKTTLKDRKPGKTDFKRLRAMKDSDIDYTDIPELPADFWKKAALYTQRKQSVSVRLDPDVLDWLKSKGAGYQTRLNAILRAVMDQEQSRRNH